MLTFQKLQEQAAEAGITQADVDAEIAAVRAKKKRTRFTAAKSTTQTAAAST